MALLDLEKLRKDINILFGYVRCLMAKSDEDCPLVATEWSANHINATGNPYTAGTYVFYNGHVYKCLFNNEGILPSNTTYWLDLGEGHLLAEEQTDWNATGGRRYILNKPTNTSDFFNDGEDGSSPYATMNDVSAAIPQAQDIDSVLGEGDTAADKDINVQSIGLWDNFAAPFGFARITADKSRINFISKLGTTMGYISQETFNLVQGAFSFTINLPTLTSNRVATFQDKSGVVAYLSDITGASTDYKFVDTTQVTYLGSVIGLTETIVSQTTILGNTLSDEDLIKKIFRITKGTTLGNVSIRLKVNTSNTLVGATQIGLSTLTTSYKNALMYRHINLYNGNAYCYNGTANIISDIIGTNATPTTFTYDTTADLYVFFTVQLANVADEFTFQLAYISN